MAYTRDQFVTEIADTVGKSENASALSGAVLQDRIRTYLNWAQRRLSRVHDFHELNGLITTATTVTDLKTYPLITGTNNLGLTNLKDIASIRLDDNENSYNLVRWRYRRFDQKYPRPENYTTGRPTIYTRWGANLELFRIPDAAYTLKIRYTKYPTDFTTGSQESDFTNKDQVLFTIGVFETYMQLEEYGDAKVWLERLYGQLSDVIHAEGDLDWEPESSPGLFNYYNSGQPQYDPYGDPGDPLYGYTE